ncbi:MAG: hypothetical protein LC754_10600 [Acidobacteria bacterium]|nr:hypothetical protein [Acidobacteriota bacterium]
MTTTETPITDFLEDWWKPEMYLAGKYSDMYGGYCAAGALMKIREMRDQAWRDQCLTLRCSADLLEDTNDHGGRDAVLQLLRETERELRGRGIL